MKMQKKKGVSLIVIAISIVVIIILVSAVIINLRNNNIFINSRAAVFKSDISTFKEELEISKTLDSTIKNRQKFNVRRYNYEKNEFVTEMKKIIPSFKEKYADKIEVKNDMLQYIGEDENERAWVNAVIHVACKITIDYVDENSNKVADSINKILVDGHYEVESPYVVGYEPEYYIVQGDILEDTTIEVIYYRESDGLSYIGLNLSGEETEDENEIVSYAVSGIGSFTGEKLVIPRKYNNKEVTKIKSHSLKSNNTIKLVIIPETIKKIGNEAIRSCGNLEYINLNAETVGDACFKTSGSLKKIDIGTNVKKINSYTFDSCTKLNDLTIYSSNVDINGIIFNNCTSLKEIKTNEKNSKYDVMDGVLFSKDGKKIFMYPQAKDGDYIIANSVEEIGYAAFNGAIKLTKMDIPSNVKIVRDRAFLSCIGITQIRINCKSLESYAFRNMPSLKKIEIGINIKSLDNYIFYDTKNIEEVKYWGTTTEFNSISKAVYWYGGSNITQIICTDGTITL